jgi:hypothetical protein
MTKKAGGILIVLLLIALIPAVSSYEQTFKESQLVYGYGEFSGIQTAKNFSFLKVKDIIGLKGIDAYAYVCSSERLSPSQKGYFTTNNYGHTSITGTIGEDTIFTGQIYYNSNLNPDGTLKEVIHLIEFDNIDIKSYTGEYSIKLNWNQNIVPPSQEKGEKRWDDMKYANDRYSEYPIALASSISSGYVSYALNGKHMYHDKDDWYNTVKITESDLKYTVDFIRGNNPSWAEITDAATGFLIYSSSYITDDVTFDVNKWLITSGKINVTVVSPNGNAYNILYPPSAPSSSVTIYVKSSQTGALLADAHIVIQDTTTEPWTEVVNQTLTSGYGIISLAKDPGFNPTQYHISATVPGYQQVVPALFFRVTGPTDIVVEMEPLKGGPVNEDNTFLEFYVRDLNANGISNAQVFVDGQLRWTNAAGYTQIEVAKNASYPYSVSKSGYVTIEGTATVGDGPRYTVNVVLGPKEIPTYTPDPGETPGGPGATPTPDRRTNEEKGQAVIDMIADNAEGIGALALICLLMGLLKLMAKW